ncbi:uncharacterized protein LOC143462421 [Clavelina lepadiformis]|uniref:uncharacterized protein LOC143462421 n=1 Tax=Clavelina lepadiformis TaxID=159417 RepID=UPI004040EDEF
MKTFQIAITLFTLFMPLCSSLRCYSCTILNAQNISIACSESEIAQCSDGLNYCFVSAAYLATTGYQGTTISRGCRATRGQNICPIIPQGESIATLCTQTCTTDECNKTDGNGSIAMHQANILLFLSFTLLSVMIICN